MSLIVIGGLSRASHADAGTYCADYSSQAAKRKTGLSAMPASAAAGAANTVSVSEPGPRRYSDTPEGKWQQAYDKAFAGCMQNYASDPVTASTDPGAELGKTEMAPKTKARPARKFKARAEGRRVKKLRAEGRPAKKARAKVEERPVKKAKVEEPSAKKVIAKAEEPPISAKRRRTKQGSRLINPIVKKQASYCDSRPASDPACKNKSRPVATSISIKPGSETNVPVSGH